MKNDYDELACINMDDGRLVFEPPEVLTDEERDRADLHLGYCPACQTDFDFDFLLNKFGEKNSRSETIKDLPFNKTISLQSSESVFDPLVTSQLSLPFDNPVVIEKRTKKAVIRLGDPAIPVKVCEYGTYVAKLDHIWRAARTYARRNNYKLLEMYGVIGVAPFCEDKVGAWLNYLNIQFRQPVEVYQLYDKDLTWIAEWSIK